MIGNRIVAAIALMLIVPAIVLIFAFSFGGNKDMGEAAQQKNMESYTEKLNQRNADIIFYDKDPIGPANLKARRVNALNDQGLALNLFSDKAFHVIILDDMDGTLSLTDQDIQKLKDLLMNHHFRNYCRFLNYTCIRRYISLKDSNSARLHVRIFNRSYYFRI